VKSIAASRGVVGSGGLICFCSYCYGAVDMAGQSFWARCSHAPGTGCALLVDGMWKVELGRLSDRGVCCTSRFRVLYRMDFDDF